MQALMVLLLVAAPAEAPWEALARFEQKAENAKWSGQIDIKGVLPNGKTGQLSVDFTIKHKGDAWYALVEKTNLGSKKTFGIEAVISPREFLFLNFDGSRSAPKLRGLRSRATSPDDRQYGMITGDLMLAPAGIFPGLGWHRASELAKANAANIQPLPEGGGFAVKTPYGLLTWYVDPVTKELARVNVKQTIGDLAPWGTEGDVKAPKVIRETSSYRGVEAEVAIRSGCITAKTKDFEAGGVMTGTRVLTYKLEPLAPNEPAFKLTIPIPNGTVVTVIDEEEIDYEWRDGKVHKRYSRGFTEAPPPALPAAMDYSSLLISAGIAAALLVGVVYLVWRLRR
jgi:hypothetical protein